MQVANSLLFEKKKRSKESFKSLEKHTLYSDM